MMSLVVQIVAVSMLAPVLAAAQATVTGTWEGQTPNRQAVVLELDAKGTALTGTMTVGGEKAAIELGKVAKNTVSFSVAMGGGTEAFTGELDADELTIWMDDRGPRAAITLKRAK